MNHSLFTVEEENLICVFDLSSRYTLIACIYTALPDFDEPEMREIAQSALRKLDGMSDAAFAETVFTPAYHDDESEV